MSLEKGQVLAEEADLLNLAVFGCTAKEWRETNGIHEPFCDNIRDCADSFELIVLANLEAVNAQLISEGKPKEQRFDALCKSAKMQLTSLRNNASAVKMIQSPNKIKDGLTSGSRLKGKN